MLTVQPLLDSTGGTVLGGHVCVALLLAMASSAMAASDERGLAMAWLSQPTQSSVMLTPSSLSFEKGTDQHWPIIEVDPTARFQQIEGFGANLTESSVININSLPPNQRSRVMRLLFDRREGAAFSFIRVPLGSTDFSHGNYTYNDTHNNEPDPDLTHFSIEPDMATLRLLEEAQALNPELRVMLTPWSPPAWMKTSGQINGGRLKPEFRQSLALYLAKSVEAFQAHGIFVDSLSIQNEPAHDTEQFPSMFMSPPEQADFVRDFLAPTFAARNLSVKILILDHNWNMADWAIQMLEDPGVQSAVGGIAYHCYKGELEDMLPALKLFPHVGAYQTECTGFASADFTGDFHWWLRHQIIKATQLGAKTGLGWNMVLNQNFGPTNGGCQDCRGLLDIHTRTGAVTVNSEYFALAHASRFLHPGAVRIQTTQFVGGPLQNVGFQNPDGSLVLIVTNPTREPALFYVKDTAGRVLGYSLPAFGAVTIEWQDSPPASAPVPGSSMSLVAN